MTHLGVFDRDGEDIVECTFFVLVGPVAKPVFPSADTEARTGTQDDSGF